MKRLEPISWEESHALGRRFLEARRRDRGTVRTSEPHKRLFDTASEIPCYRGSGGPDANDHLICPRRLLGDGSLIRNLHQSTTCRGMRPAPESPFKSGKCSTQASRLAGVELARQLTADRRCFKSNYLWAPHDWTPFRMLQKYVLRPVDRLS